MSEDAKVATFLMRQMLSYPKLSIEILKDQFHLGNLQVRQALIRLYYNNRVFGEIVTDEGSGKKFLVFTPATRHPSQISLEKIIDWDLSKFDLSALKADALTSSSEKPSLEPKALNFSVTSGPDLFSTSETHQKDLISSEMTVGIDTYAIQASVILRNNSEASIQNVKFRLNFPSVLKFLSITPTCIIEKKEQSIFIELGEIGAAQAHRCVFNFLPTMERYPYKLDGIVQYKSMEGFARIIRLENITITIDVPLIKPHNGTPEIVSNLMEDPKMIKQFQGVGCPGLYDMNPAHAYLEMIAQGLGFKRVQGIEHLPPYTTFFIGSSLNQHGKLYQILVSPQVSNNVLAFYVCSPYEMIGYSVIWKLFAELQDKLRQEGLLPQNQNLIKMDCIVCNHILSDFPPKGDPIACRYCQTLQIPWS